MRRRQLTRALAAGFILAATACGTTLPDSSFDSLGSGKPVISTESPGATGTTGTGGATVGGNGSGGTGGATTNGGSSGSAGTQGTKGHTVTSGGSKGSSSGGGPGASSCSGGAPTASDVGVTNNQIKIGIIYSGNNPFAPNQFIVSYYGLASWVAYINAHGGICGRQLVLAKCDDGGDRNRDISCARSLIQQDKVFALVGSNVYQYSGAQFVSQSHVPDIGGQPVTGNAYYTYPGLFSIEGSYYLNNGSPPGSYYGGHGLGTWFKSHLHITRAGVIYYAQPDSVRGANYIKGWLQGAGVHVDVEQVPLAGDPAPQVNDMKSKHDQAIFDALDINGNLKVCRAQQQYGFNVPHVSTISTWTSEVGSAMSGLPCLSKYYSWGESTNYADSSNAQAKTFQQAYAQYAHGAPLSQWSLEGWAAGMWFTDAAKHCGAKLTRGCVEQFANSKAGYGASGLLDPNTTRFPRWGSKPSSIKQCYTIVQWSGGSSGTWATKADHKSNCYTTSAFSYTGG